MCPELTPGPNLGDDVIYSGTVAAAMEGRHLGFTALAVSLDGHKHYDTAAAVTCSILRALCKEPLRTGRILILTFRIYPWIKSKVFA
ncbi:stationary phase survival protein SurE [Escherichia coli]|uniref:5'-nucleotidase n=1 Tax=Escherichia coli TaxID=562 RepID=A0A377CUY7_ECOLX|nr:stationary phase survival protein SurE [Escherichia coli]